MSAFRNLGAGVLFLAAVATPRSIEASTCGAVEYTFVPGPSGVVPRNARVWLTLPTTWELTGTCRATSAKRCPEPEGQYALVLRSATTGKDVKTRIDHTTGQEDRVLSVRGFDPLDANTRYEVWLVRGETGRILGTFRTNAEIDQTPPSWSKRVRVVDVRGAAPRKLARGKGGVVTLPDGLALDGPFVTLEVDAPVDGPSPFVALRIHTMNGTFPGGNVIIPVAAGGGPTQLTLGGSLPPCAYSAIALPERPERVKISVQAIDIAGNLGEETSLTVNLPR